MTKAIAAKIAAVMTLAGLGFAPLPTMAQSVMATPALTAPGPATVGPTVCSRIGPNDDDPINENAGQFAARLNDLGYSVSGVENFGNCLRAYLTEPDGRQVMAYFDPTTLERILSVG